MWYYTNDEPRAGRSSTNIISNQNNTTFLQSANVKLTDMRHQHCEDARVLFDGCSQKSFVTEDFAWFRNNTYRKNDC